MANGTRLRLTIPNIEPLPNSVIGEMRRDTRLKIRGQRVEPGEIEAALDAETDAAPAPPGPNAELEAIVARQKDDPMLLFGNPNPAEDPTQQTEDLGANAVDPRRPDAFEVILARRDHRRQGRTPRGYDHRADLRTGRRARP